MNDLTIFENKDFGSIRILEIDGKLLFCGSDVAKSLGYAKPQNAIDAHCRYTLKRGIPHPQSPGKTIEMLFIPEGDLYRLITNSKLPSAEKFETWVFDEVLPTIRKTGSYNAAPQGIELLALAVLEADKTINLLKADNSRLAVQNTIMTPKAEYFDDLVERNLLTNFRDAAKELKVGQRYFIKFLLEKKYVYRDKKGKIKPFAGHDDLFEIKEAMNEKTGWAGTQTLITPKGRETFRLLMI